MKVKDIGLGLAAATLLVFLGTLAVSAGLSRGGQAGDAGGELLEQGRYLAMIAGCNDCHTDGYLLSEGKVPEVEWLTGSDFGWRGPWGTTYAVNLRLFMEPLTEEQWVGTARHLRARPPMPWFDVNILREEDLRALYRYIRHLGPGGRPAPAYLSPGLEPVTPYAMFPSPPPQKQPAEK